MSKQHEQLAVRGKQLVRVSATSSVSANTTNKQVTRRRSTRVTITSANGMDKQHENKHHEQATRQHEQTSNTSKRDHDQYDEQVAWAQHDTNTSTQHDHEQHDRN